VRGELARGRLGVIEVREELVQLVGRDRSAVPGGVHDEEVVEGPSTELVRELVEEGLDAQLGVPRCEGVDAVQRERSDGVCERGRVLRAIAAVAALDLVLMSGLLDVEYRAHTHRKESLSHPIGFRTIRIVVTSLTDGPAENP
jgi:hypothetical protein